MRAVVLMMAKTVSVALQLAKLKELVCDPTWVLLQAQECCEWYSEAVPMTFMHKDGHVVKTHDDDFTRFSARLGVTDTTPWKKLLQAIAGENWTKL